VTKVATEKRRARAPWALRRAGVSVLTLLVVSVAIFFVLRVLPGDPVAVRLGASAGVDQDMIDRLRAEAGLDEPVLTQYLQWMAGVLHLDFGESYFTDRPVGELIAERFPVTAELTLLSIALSVVLAVGAALLAVRRPGGPADRAMSTLSSLGMAFPPFVAGILLVIVFSVTLGWLPARGYEPFLSNPVGNLQHMILPAIALSAAAAPLILRYARSELIEALSSSYVRTAEGKGASGTRVVLRHALPNAAIPTLTMIGLVTGYTLGGSVVVEYVFGLSGLGSLSVEAAFRRDYAVLQSTVLLISALFIAVSLAVDLLAARLDPRTGDRR
jgi:peptide/nickel transport system permease protein